MGAGLWDWKGLKLNVLRFRVGVTYSVQEPYVKIPEDTIREALKVVLGITEPLELKASFF